MSNDRANELIKELIQELEQETALDLATVEQAKLLQNKFEDILNPDLDTSNNTMLDDVIALEASFATTHPVAEKLVRELVNTLSRLGI
ncbi:MAG TPA: hypothetical protein DCL66_13580 [Gammaproteobacteria bacterium]|nr:hypothetical protein [Gammaproteobacteria bacterium]|tara:strand:+ start:252 stop:515 length:264 start_codon:yes stop_codon:yes gene_type:complete